MAGIKDWDSFHDLFASALGFPRFYGRNMDAWMDCMSYLDQPQEQMTSVHVASGTVLVLQLEGVNDFAARCPEIYASIVECSAFVNWRRIERGFEAVLALSFYKSP